MKEQISIYDTAVKTQNTVIFGDAVDALRILADKSVDTCVTSPPYYGLRDYGKDDQIGLEDTPEEYIEKLVAVFREVRRVLKDDGTLWVNIADSYAGSGKGRLKDGTARQKTFGKISSGSKGTWIGNLQKTCAADCKPKDLIGIPWMLAFALRRDGWYLRQDIIWQKPNPMPESVKDRCTKCHEYIFLLSKSPRYYFDGEAISEPVSDSSMARYSQNIDVQKGSNRVPGKSNGTMKAVRPRYGGKKYTETPDQFYRTKSGGAYDFRPKRNKRDVWTVSTKPFIPKRGVPIDFPVNVTCIFYMPTRRACDLTNLLEAIDDVMVKAGLLKDDNYNIIASHDGSRVLYDKANPRTEVIISKFKE